MKTSDEEIAKGEKKLADAGKQISQIKNPKWYLYDRSTLTEYDGFGENADRMRAIGKVFPVMFFLVAALISLTGMTRMVEEQRIEIGTMKALGYGNFSIASPKYPEIRRSSDAYNNSHTFQIKTTYRYLQSAYSEYASYHSAT